MNIILSFVITFSLTLTACLLLTNFLQWRLYQSLVVLCRTEDLAKFWVAFVNILQVGLPAVIALKFQPEASTLEDSFFEILGRFGGNLAVFLVMQTCIGIVISFFALVSPRIREDAR
jgi:hypothetical protein